MGENHFDVVAHDQYGFTSAPLVITINRTEAPAPVVELISALLTNHPNYTLIYKVDGVEQRETIQLQEGENSIERVLTGSAGGQAREAA